MNKKTIWVLSLIWTIATSAYAYKNKKEIKKYISVSKEYLKEKIKEIKSQWELFSEKEKEAILDWLAKAHEDLVKFFNWEKTNSNFKIFDWSWKEVLSLTDFLKSKK